MKKILIIGAVPLNFTTEIIKALLLEGYKISVFNTHKPNIDIEDNLLKKIEVIEIVHPIKYLSKLKRFTTGLFFGNFFILKMILNGKITNVKELYQNCLISKYKNRLKEFDIVNFQQLSFNSAWLNFIKKDTRVISSFWGSDLLIDDTEISLKRKKKFIERSAVITLQNLKMKNTFIQKYGDSPNVKMILFPLKNEIFEYINKEVKEKKDIINVGIGYNAHKRQNHAKIINSIIKLKTNLKNRIHLNLFFQYGGDKEYKNEIIQLIKENQLSYEVFSRFLNPKELAEKWNKMDIMIILPVSDAFSASVSENLYAENILITGTWLPYSLYKKQDVYFEEVTDFNELHIKLNTIINNFQEYSFKTKGNRQKVLKTLDFDGNLKKWVNLYS